MRNQNKVKFEEICVDSVKARNKLDNLKHKF